jgi:small subunit ribosomal protein S9
LEGRLTATGKRKNAIACVILKPGKGQRMINGRPIKEYLRGDTLLFAVEEPFRMLEVVDSYDLVARVKGGGLSGQAGALRLGVSRALAQVGEDYRKKLRAKGFMTRDPRVVERKKYGQAGARARFQFSKR